MVPGDLRWIPPEGQRAGKDQRMVEAEGPGRAGQAGAPELTSLEKRLEGHVLIRNVRPSCPDDQATLQFRCQVQSLGLLQFATKLEHEQRIVVALREPLRHRVQSLLNVLVQTALVG